MTCGVLRFALLLVVTIVVHSTILSMFLDRRHLLSISVQRSLQAPSARRTAIRACLSSLLACSSCTCRGRWSISQSSESHQRIRRVCLVIIAALVLMLLRFPRSWWSSMIGFFRRRRAIGPSWARRRRRVGRRTRRMTTARRSSLYLSSVLLVHRCC